LEPAWKQLNVIIGTHAEALKNLDDESASIKPASGKWSKKEELGHLVDSAHNNLRRFVVAQHEHEPHIVYDQDEWVRLNNYNSISIVQLSRLWLLMNQQIASVLENMKPEAAMRKCNTGKNVPELHTLEWLAEDYLRHMRHHLHHLLGLELLPY
jgi:hypothetical protein